MQDFLFCLSSLFGWNVALINFLEKKYGNGAKKKKLDQKKEHKNWEEMEIY